MNLNTIVSRAVGAVNPQKLIEVQVSSGYTTNPDGSRVPSYNAPVYVWGQLQPMQYNDILQVEGLNLQGVRQKLYINGAVEGLIRGRKMGGDLVTFPDVLFNAYIDDGLGGGLYDETPGTVLTVTNVWTGSINAAATPILWSQFAVACNITSQLTGATGGPGTYQLSGGAQAVGPAKMATGLNGQVWKIALITEAWPDWTSGIVTLQDPAAV